MNQYFLTHTLNRNIFKILIVNVPIINIKITPLTITKGALPLEPELALWRGTSTMKVIHTTIHVKYKRVGLIL